MLIKLLNKNKNFHKKIEKYLNFGEIGILNLLIKNLNNIEWKLNINGFYEDKKMCEWYCNYSNFNLNNLNEYLCCKMNFYNIFKIIFNKKKKNIETIYLYDRLNFLNFMIKNEYKITKKDLKIVSSLDSRKCLDYLLENFINYISPIVQFNIIINGNLNALIKLHNKNIQLSRYLIYKALEKNRIDCFWYLFKNGPKIPKLEWNDANNKCEDQEYIEDFWFNEEIYNCFTFYENLEFSNSNYTENEHLEHYLFRLNSKLYRRIISEFSDSELQLNEVYVNDIYVDSSSHIDDDLIDHNIPKYSLCELCCKNNKINILKYLVKKGYKITNNCINLALNNNEILSYLIKNN